VKKSINIWAAPENLSFEDKLGRIKKAGFEAVELNLAEEGFLSLLSSGSEVREVKNTVSGAGLEIASLLGPFWKYPLTSGSADVRKKGEEILAVALETAGRLGTDALLVVPGLVEDAQADHSETGYREAYERSQESIRKAVPAASRLKVAICVENVWNRFLLSPLEMKKYVEECGSEFVRVYFDVGNVLVQGFPEMWIRILGGLIKRIHLKDFKTAVGNGHGFCDLLEGDVNWPAVGQALREIGYDGYLTAEVGPYRYYPEVVLYHTSISMDRIMNRT